MRKLFLAPFLLAFFSGAAIAQGSSPPPFDQVDADGDGNVSQQELQDANVQGVDVTSADQDQDGVLGRDEYEQATQSGSQGSSQ